MRARLSRLTALLLALTMLVAFAALAVLASHAAHDCAGEHCPVCDWLIRCERAVGALALIGLAAPAAAALGEVGAAPSRRTGEARCAVTPVSLGVRMRN